MTDLTPEEFAAQEGEYDAPPFNEWLKQTHPEVNLLPMQQKWVNRVENGDTTVWIGGQGSGKTFIMNLYKEYIDARGY